MNAPIVRIPLGGWVNDAVDWIMSTFSWLFSYIKSFFTTIFEALLWVFSAPPFFVVIIVLAAIAYFAKGWKLAAGSVVSLLLIHSLNQWSNAMNTLALTLLASTIVVLISVPLGIYAARNDTASGMIRPVLDFLQTMPAFVYLIPTVMIFRAGVMPGLIATMVFALAPAVRLTELGIRQVDSEVVEAGQAFGSSSKRILRQIELPLAMPTIMAGVNQVIMLALSMVVIAGMVGAGGLGLEVYKALTQVQVGLGFEAGLAVVLLAVYLDRVTGALGDRSPIARAERLSVEQ